MQRVFTVPFYIAGTLGGDWAASFQFPFDVQMIAVSACVSDANAAGIEVGTSADADAYITKFSSGVSGTPVEKKAITDFNGATASSQFPHITAGTVIKLTVDHDYNGGGAGADSDDLCVVLTFTEG
jgi:hypothetical protein